MYPNQNGIYYFKDFILKKGNRKLGLNIKNSGSN